MDLLKKYATKKKIFLTAFIYSGIYTVLCLIGNLMGDSSLSGDISSATAILSTLSTMITVLQIVFYVMLIVAIIVTVLAGVYFFLKDKSDYVMLGEFIGYAISSVLLLLSISGINAICKVVKVVASGDYSSYLSMDYTSMMSSIETAGDCLNYFKWIMIILFVLNLIVFLIIKNVIKLNNFSYSLVEGVSTGGERKIVSYDPQTGEPIYEEVPAGDTVNNVSNQPSFDIKGFLKTKNGKIVVGVIAAVILVFGGYKIYDTYFNKTTIDLLENVKVEFSGYDGNGRVSSCHIGDIDYDKTNAELQSFINSISLDYGNDNDLKNGDEIEINAVYDQTKAEELKLDIKNATKTVKVKDLTERYKKASEVPSKTSSAIKKLMDEEMKADYDERESSYRTYKTSFISMYYAYDEESTTSSADYCIGVYKIEQTSTSGDTPETQTYFAIAYMGGVDSSYSSENKKSIYTTNLYNDDYDTFSDESQVEAAVKNNRRFNDHKVSKFS